MFTFSLQKYNFREIDGCKRSLGLIGLSSKLFCQLPSFILHILRSIDEKNFIFLYFAYLLSYISPSYGTNWWVFTVTKTT